ncbi:hypothetical protein EVAR_67608_1 [Eumeta japonica]|uniref:Uncharacterized protein n=1 Tax=Eumeta variegata TaxID=151549 RepID=A0A4C1ZMT8_EUMVA|nr:hypothetical protein EVAR_67608_1 [Eumeta japonica]
MTDISQRLTRAAHGGARSESGNSNEEFKDFNPTEYSVYVITQRFKTPKYPSASLKESVQTLRVVSDYLRDVPLMMVSASSSFVQPWEQLYPVSLRDSVNLGATPSKPASGNRRAPPHRRPAAPAGDAAQRPAPTTVAACHGRSILPQPAGGMFTENDRGCIVVTSQLRQGEISRALGRRWSDPSGATRHLIPRSADVAPSRDRPPAPAGRVINHIRRRAARRLGDADAHSNIYFRVAAVTSMREIVQSREIEARVSRGGHRPPAAEQVYRVRCGAKCPAKAQP